MDERERKKVAGRCLGWMAVRAQACEGDGSLFLKAQAARLCCAR